MHRRHTTHTQSTPQPPTNGTSGMTVASGDAHTMPADAPVMLQEMLRALAGCRVSLVIEPADVAVFTQAIKHTSTHIASFVSTDPDAFDSVSHNSVAATGSSLGLTHTSSPDSRPMLLGRPIVTPEDVSVTGATDVVLCRWPSDDALWSQRAVFLRQSLAVHRLFGEQSSGHQPKRWAA